MNIVALDGYALNPGDLDWSVFESFGTVSVFERTAPEEVESRSKDAEVIFTNKVKLDAELIGRLPKLKFINVTATGYDNVDLKAATEHDITVCNVPDYSSDSVAQHTFALILEIYNQVGLHSQSVRDGVWQRAADFAYALSPLRELKGKTIGLVGLGNIGLKTAAIARAFGMNVLYWSRSQKQVEGATYRSIVEIFEESDVVSLHIPLTAENRGFVNGSLLSKMRPSSILINTARGGLIHEQDLADALNQGHIAAAGIDVLSQEPPVPENPLPGAKNCFITPHNAWMSIEARQRIIDIMHANLSAFVKGEKLNTVN